MIFVTGGTGYLGSSLIELLVSEGHAVRALVRRPERASVLPAGVEQVAGDLSDEDVLARAMDGCEGVFHLAASVGHDLEETRQFNTEGTRRVVRAAQRAGVARLVHTSSSAAIIDASGLVSEQAAEGATALIDPYSVTKAEAEAVVFDAVRAGLDARIVNVVNAYGPSPVGPASYNRLLLAAVRGKVPVIVDARVGWVLAEDVALGHLLAYERGAAGKRYVLCGETATFPTFLKKSCEAWGAPYTTKALPPGSDVPPDAILFAVRSQVYGKLGPVTIEDTQARAIGFAPRGIDEGLRITIEWLKSTAP